MCLQQCSTAHGLHPFGKTHPNLKAYIAFLIRDGLVLTATVLLWLVKPESYWLQLTTGVLTGVCALLFHEYGHLYGAKRSNAVVTPAPLWSPFIFNLNPSDNSKEQLLQISFWGFGATALFVAFFVVALPLDTTAGQWGLGIGLVLASLTAIIEFPIAWRMAKDKPLPDLSIFTNNRS